MLLPHLRRLLRDRFLLGMLLAVGLAVLTPQSGRSGGTLHLDALSNAGIFTVFFLHGIGLSMQSLRAGLLNWRLHTLVQAHTFLVFPLLWLGLDALFGAEEEFQYTPASALRAVSGTRSGFEKNG